MYLHKYTEKHIKNTQIAMICTFLCGAANKKRTRDLVPTNDVSNFSKKWSIDTVTIYCVFLLIVLYILSYYEKMVVINSEN